MFSKKVTLIFSFLLLLVSSTFALEKANISVIMSRDSKMHKKALTGFKKIFHKATIFPNISLYSMEKLTSSEITMQIKKTKPQIIYTVGQRAAYFVKEKGFSSPVVFCMVLNPDEIASESITGVSMNIPAELKLKSIKEMFPHTKKVGMLYSDYTADKQKSIAEQCEKLKLELFTKHISSSGAFINTFKNISDKIDCYLMLLDTGLYTGQTVRFLLSGSLKEKYYVIGLSSYFTKAGALISFHCDYVDLGRQAGGIAVRIIKGEKPSDIKPIPPRKVVYSVNSAVAEKIDIKLSDEVLDGADEVFKN